MGARRGHARTKQHTGAGGITAVAEIKRRASRAGLAFSQGTNVESEMRCGGGVVGEAVRFF